MSAAEYSLGQEDALVRGMKLATGLLARREHSRQELRRKLQARGFNEDAIEAILERLVAGNYLNERRFLEQYVHQRRQRGYGPIRIKLELQERGIDGALIEDYLDEADDRWIAQARAVRMKKFGEMPPETVNDKARQLQFLRYRGFTSSHTRSLFRDDAFI